MLSGNFTTFDDLELKFTRFLRSGAQHPPTQNNRSCRVFVQYSPPGWTRLYKQAGSGALKSISNRDSIWVSLEAPERVQSSRARSQKIWISQDFQSSKFQKRRNCWKNPPPPRFKLMISKLKLYSQWGFLMFVVTFSIISIEVIENMVNKVQSDS